MPAVMAKYGCQVLATDIEPVEEGDAHWGASSAADIFYDGICSQELFLQQVGFRNMDMAGIPADLTGRFDFLWSCCALEHLGSLAAGIDFVLDSVKCLRPGGVAVHTTELNLSPRLGTLETPGLSLYRKSDVKELKRRLRSRGARLMPCNWTKGDLPQDAYVDLPPYQEDVHLKLMIEQFVVTSMGLLIIRR